MVVLIDDVIGAATYTLLGGVLGLACLLAGVWLVPKISNALTPKMREELLNKIMELKQNGLIVQRRNLAIRNAEISLVRNFSDNGKDEFTAWISGQAQRVFLDEKTGKIKSGDTYVVDFEEYWTFRRSGNSWLLDSIESGFNSKNYTGAENLDEGTSK